jgi:hypothetical protein
MQTKTRIWSEGQGGQIGQIFAHWVLFYFWAFENLDSSPHFWPTFFKVVYLFLRKIASATFWAIFAHTHLVTLPKAKFCKQKKSSWQVKTAPGF